MKTGKRLSLILLVCLLPLVAACPQGGQQDREIRAEAEPLLDNQLQGISQDKYDLYIKDYTEALQMLLDKERFAKIRDQITGKFGKYESRTYLGFLKKGQETQVLWKAKFDKSQDDILVRLVFTKKKGKNQIMGLYFH